MVHSLAEALAACAGDDEVFVIGGAQIYREALPLAERIYLTRIDADYAGDTFFPVLSAEQWREASREPRAAEEPVEPAYEFVVMVRLSGTATPASPGAGQR